MKLLYYGKKNTPIGFIIIGVDKIRNTYLIHLFIMVKNFDLNKILLRYRQLFISIYSYVKNKKVRFVYMIVKDKYKNVLHYSETDEFLYLP